MCQIISIANQKDGVGKTTLNLGTDLALKGFKVLLIDLDPQANLSSYLGFEWDGKLTISHLMLCSHIVFNLTGITDIPAEEFSKFIRTSEENKISYIPADTNLANVESYLMNALSRETEMVLKRILKRENLKNYDYVLVYPPSLGILSINALTAADKIIIPVQTGFSVILKEVKDLEEILG